jgi:isoquinoline 1-oxidoreductase beta subunit
MGASWDRVRIVQADGDARYGDQNTDGSQSVRLFLRPMRVAGATARTMLIAAAAARLGVPASQLEAHDHAVHHQATGRSIGFGELAEAAAKMPLPDPKTVALRPDAELKRVGTELPLVDGPAFVTGQALFGADVRVPGMLTAVIARPPVLGGTIASVDDSAALAVPGVRRVVRLPEWKAPGGFAPLGGVAVVADHTWAAMRGRDALVVEWTDGAHASFDSDTYAAALQAAARAPGKVERQKGDVEAALAGAARVVSAEYHVPHLAHAPMEPPAALAVVKDGTCEAWACTQNPQAARTEVAQALGIDASKVTIHVTFLGGGFGRKSKPDYVVEAALLAREMGAPVRVQWTRTDEIRHGYYHAASGQRMEAALDANGRVTALRFRVASPSIDSTFDAKADRLAGWEVGQGLTDLPLAVPNVRVESCPAVNHVRIGWLRSVYNINHAFGVQSFIAELAAATGRDHRDVLLEVLGPARHATAEEIGVAKVENYGEPLDTHPVDVGRLRNVIDRVTAAAGWGKPGRVLGLAAHRSFVTYVAVAVSLARAGKGLALDEVWICADPGRVVNLDRVKSQFEGAVIFGATVAIHGALTAKNGRIEQTNLRDYPLLRLGETPRAIHVDVVPSQAPPGGVGEPGVPPVAPAIANAVFAMTGTRVRSLPLRRSPAWTGETA